MGGKWWIATQAPLPRTIHPFLSLFLSPISNPLDPSLGQFSVRTIVQLTRDVEAGRKKADPYFPTVVGTSTVVNPEPGSGLPSFKLPSYNRNHSPKNVVRKVQYLSCP
jgi:protein-tyrosine phosphatase